MNNDNTDTVYRVVAELATSRPNTVAIRAKGRIDLDYAGLLASMNHTRQTLRGLGLGRNERIAIVGLNGPEMALMLLGSLGGATCAPLNAKYTVSEFAFYLSDLKARAVIVAQGLASAVREAAGNLGIQLIEMSTPDQTRIGDLRLSAVSVPGAPPCSSAPEDTADGDTQPGDIALVLHTSGTTSRPKLVPLTQRNVCDSVRNIVETLQLTPRDCCLNIMPLFHIHGIVAGLLAPLASGGSVICSPGFSDDPFFITQLPSWIQEMQPSWYTAVPSMHQAILTCARRYPETVEQCRLRFIRSSSAPLPPQVMRELEETFRAPVIEAYGMTEASHQIASNPLPPGPRKLRSVGVATGSMIAIMDEHGCMLKSGERGEIVIQGSNIMGGYENNDAANKEAFFGEWFRTGDEGFLDGDNYLFITDRLKEQINRAGEKISPREIDEALLEHPAVLQAVAFTFPHPTLGEVPAAAVVLREGYNVESQTLQDFLGKKLASFKVPNPIYLVDEIPKGPTGKLQRIGLAAKMISTAKR